METNGRDIRREMERVRHDLDEDVENLSGNMRTLGDWKHYVRSYPWACLGAAAAVGYLAIPKRVEIVSPDMDALLKLAKKNKLVVEANPTPEAKGGFAGAAFNFLSNMVIRGAIAYLGQKVGQMSQNVAAEPRPPLHAEGDEHV